MGVQTGNLMVVSVPRAAACLPAPVSVLLCLGRSTHSHCDSIAFLWSRKFVARLAGGQAFRSRAPAFKFQCVWESLQSCQPDGLCNFGCAKP